MIEAGGPGLVKRQALPIRERRCGMVAEKHMTIGQEGGHKAPRASPGDEGVGLGHQGPIRPMGCLGHSLDRDIGEACGFLGAFWHKNNPLSSGVFFCQR